MRVTSLDHAPTQSSYRLAGDKQSGFCGGFPCCRAFNHETLYVMAGTIWGLGVVACLADGMSIFHQVKENGATHAQILTTVISSLVIGVLLGWFVFCPLANKNIDRLTKEVNPSWHACFRARFWAFFITFDGVTSYIGHNVCQGTSSGDIAFQLCFGALDFAIFGALLISFFTYFTRWQAFKPEAKTGLSAALITEKEESEARGDAIVDSNA